MTVAVVGAGLAGLRTCEALRAGGYDGRVVLVGDETHLPYSRPPLSKEVLRGDAEASAATLRAPEQLAVLEIDLQLGRPAARISVAERELEMHDGSTLRFDHAVLATGARPRRPPGMRLDGVHVLRTVDDCLALRHELCAGARVVVIGAGFIGLEVAASAQTRACTVTVVDPLATPLARALDPSLGAAVARVHAEHDVSVRCRVGVVEVTGGDDRGYGVVLTDDTRLDADVVVAGVGVAPATRWLEGSGLRIDDGVVCDASLRAAPGVWAVGDLARWHVPSLGRTVRVEHWTNALEQPDLVARNIVSGDAEPFVTVPYFWSDQWDAKVQCLGFAGAGDEVRVVRGSLDEPRWVSLVRCGDRLGGVVGLRSPGQVMKLKPLLDTGASWTDALAATCG